MVNERVETLIQQHFNKVVEKDSHIHNAYLLVHSEKLGVHVHTAKGSTGRIPAHARQPYFIASIGKLFTSVLIGILVEKGRLAYEDTIAMYVDLDVLSNLHVYKGRDYTNDIKIKHLLNHTSGLNCFFEDKPKQGKSMIDLLFEQPSRYWEPKEVIEWSKEHLTAHFPPGKGFHYSDTGYNLLGLIIEKITGMPLAEALRFHIFEPLGMNDSYLFRDSLSSVEGEYPLAHLYGRRVNVTDYRSLSVSYAGGGIISRSEDLLVFMKALINHEILSEETILAMKSDKAKFFIGIDYGYGLMNFKTVPLMMPKRYNAWGNAGSTGTFMFYQPTLDAYFIGSLNQFRYNRKAFRLLFKLIDIMSKNSGYSK